ncbi:sporulation phosphorelay system protein KapB [Oceanobacillus massiliensis]|uniref:sporulation phosphorelay system protein KapB n=1 Tax=Oceanobacillus massiliensis TaxID=1465765 RepID=UPI0002883293|nr:sporulation phosphorelay system protein KapB [Oceanobacillus massiliensis]
MTEAAIGEIVKAHYHSGTYIGEVKEDRGQNYLIEVLAVIKHPLQGDLHNYGKLEDVFFHQRKALAFHEKMNVKKAAVHSFNEQIPAYGSSLKQAVASYRQKLEAEENEFGAASLKKLDGLEKQYYQMYY